MRKLAIRCENRDEFIKAQKKLMAQGYSWYSGGNIFVPGILLSTPKKRLYIVPIEEHKKMCFNGLDAMGEIRYEKVIAAKVFIDIQQEFDFEGAKD